MLALANGRVGGFGVEGHCWTHVARRVDRYDLATRREKERLARRSGGRAWRSQPIGHCIAEAAPGVVARVVSEKRWWRQGIAGGWAQLTCGMDVTNAAAGCCNCWTCLGGISVCRLAGELRAVLGDGRVSCLRLHAPMTSAQGL
jgi:hypothetical protein